MYRVISGGRANVKYQNKSAEHIFIVYFFIFNTDYFRFFFLGGGGGGSTTQCDQPSTVSHTLIIILWDFKGRAHFLIEIHVQCHVCTISRKLYKALISSHVT